MALAIIYIFASAKPVSTRRLAVLFVLTLISATLVQAICHFRNAQRESLVVAASLTLLIWSIPPLQVLRDTIHQGSLTLDALRSVSACVQWTYGFVLAAALLFALSMLSHGTKGLEVADLAPLVTKAAMAACVTHLGMVVFRQGRARRAGYTRSEKYKVRS
jgi:hypothetical protein